MIHNTTKERLRDGEVVLGCFVRSFDATFAEYVATSGWDFLVFDAEHGSVIPSQVADLARACEVRDVSPFVRLGDSAPGTVLRCLDSGAAGLHFPWVNRPEQAQAAVAAAMYSPKGLRGLAGNRATDWVVDPEMLTRINDETLIAIQIETTEAVENVEELCEVDGVDVVFVGPSDLSQSLGVPGQGQHPSVTEAMKRVAAAVENSDKTFGLFAPNTEAAVTGLELGARYIATGAEGLLGGAMKSFMAEIRS